MVGRPPRPGMPERCSRAVSSRSLEKFGTMLFCLIIKVNHLIERLKTKTCGPKGAMSYA